MGTIRSFARKLPLLPAVYRALRRRGLVPGPSGTGAESRVFDKFYREHSWCGRESVSGPGSDCAQTKVITLEIPKLLAALGVKSVLDIPCGDFNWMQRVDLSGIDYTGADIVADLVAANEAQYGSATICFRHLNLFTDSLPQVDLVLCRDCLVHLPFADIFRALGNICRSGTNYILTTTFTGDRDNQDILMGDWRPLNLERPPFSFPTPAHLIVEGCSECDGQFADKALALWKAEDLAPAIKCHG